MDTENADGMERLRDAMTKTRRQSRRMAVLMTVISILMMLNLVLHVTR